MRDANLPFLALNPGSSLVYLTGLHFHMSERPVVLIFPLEGVPSLILPELESQKTAQAAFDLKVFTYKESLETWGVAFADACEASSVGSQRVGVEPGTLRVLELRFLEGACPGASFVTAEMAIAELRMQKDTEELALMRHATHIAENALRQTLPAVVEGVSELAIASKLVGNMLELGSGGELPFQPIIAFGANSANPHAVPSDYQLQRGDLVLFDWGANNQGYFSDLTRMFSLGEPETELCNVVEIVHRANTAAREVSAPGIPASAIDQAARTTIEAAGYGDYFVHRTGHGLGLEVHEPPYIRSDNSEILKPGMTYTIEPGIYLNGRGGARIEDDMVITADAAESLSTFPRELTVLGQ